MQFFDQNKQGRTDQQCQDLICNLGWEEAAQDKKTSQLQMPIGLSAEEQRIVELLKVSAVRIDELSIQCGLSQSQLAMHLLSLEMQGILVSLPGKVYQLN